MEEHIDTPNEIALAKRRKSFAYAMRGIILFLKTTPNAWIQLGIFSCAIILGVLFDITQVEWMMVILSAGLVLTAEAFNTAMEIDMNLTSPQYHPYARDTKDVAAGAVLMASIVAGVIGIIVFGHYLI